MDTKRSNNHNLVLDFNPVTVEAMPEIWKYLKKEHSRTTDFSYGGVLMWKEYFNYEYAITGNTLFIKGYAEDDEKRIAFSLPLGDLPLETAIHLLKSYCRNNNIPLLFSAIPGNYIDDFKIFNPASIIEIPHWEDYIYNAEKLATLSGKQMSKKRNHVNKFETEFPDWKLLPLDKSTLDDALRFMAIFENEADNTEMATKERSFTLDMIGWVCNHITEMEGAILYAGDCPCALTIGDYKDDTLYIHVEKALRGFQGSYEMINKEFALYMLKKHPEIIYINREDDAGDPGLRFAKESYHPIELLKKYNIEFHSKPNLFEHNQEITNFAMESAEFQ